MSFSVSPWCSPCPGFGGLTLATQAATIAAFLGSRAYTQGKPARQARANTPNIRP